MKKGFTLAEVLITLAIIGVVAALTIPTVIHNYQKKAQYTAFMKIYNTLEAMLNISSAENGTQGSWTFDENNPDAFYNKYITPYLKFSEKYESTEAREKLNYNVVPISGKEEEGGSLSELLGDNDSVFVLNDGAIIIPSVSTRDVDSLQSIIFIVDTNGKKGPNILGRDVFMLFYVYNDDKGKWAFILDETQEGGYNDPADCDPSNEDAFGAVSCPTKLLTEGKMNY